MDMAWWIDIHAYVKAMLSKIILMRPKTQVKNQESRKFQEWKSHSIKASVKNQQSSFKIHASKSQESSFKIQASKNQDQDSRIKRRINQDKY